MAALFKKLFSKWNLGKICWMSLIIILSSCDNYLTFIVRFLMPQISFCRTKNFNKSINF